MVTIETQIPETDQVSNTASYCPYERIYIYYYAPSMELSLSAADRLIL